MIVRWPDQVKPGASTGAMVAYVECSRRSTKPPAAIQARSI